MRVLAIAAHVRRDMRRHTVGLAMMSTSAQALGQTEPTTTIKPQQIHKIRICAHTQAIHIKSLKCGECVCMSHMCTQTQILYFTGGAIQEILKRRALGQGGGWQEHSTQSLSHITHLTYITAYVCIRIRTHARIVFVSWRLCVSLGESFFFVHTHTLAGRFDILPH